MSDQSLQEQLQEQEVQILKLKSEIYDVSHLLGKNRVSLNQLTDFVSELAEKVGVQPKENSINLEEIFEKIDQLLQQEEK